jgi:hypothetical protein
VRSHLPCQLLDLLADGQEPLPVSVTHKRHHQPRRAVHRHVHVNVVVLPASGARQESWLASAGTKSSVEQGHRYVIEVDPPCRAVDCHVHVNVAVLPAGRSVGDRQPENGQSAQEAVVQVALTAGLLMAMLCYCLQVAAAAAQRRCFARSW